MLTETLLGTCGNARWDRWDGHTHVNYRGCDQPAMALFADRFNLCVACAMRSAGYGDRLIAQVVESLDVQGAARWLAGSHDRYVDAAAFSYWMGARPREYKLEQVHKQQAHADRTADIINAMLARWAAEIRYEISVARIDPDEYGLYPEDLELIR